MAAARTPEGKRRVSTERRASLPNIMPIHPEGQDEGAIAPVANISPYSVHPEKLEVLENKDVLIVIEDETALFECKINKELDPTCTWYRNGIQIDQDRRTMIKNNGEWQKLHIKNIKVFEHGLYVLECRYLDRYINVCHRLYVCPRVSHRSLFHFTQHVFKTGVIKHLINTKVYNGATINLVAVFANEAEKYFWFKNNEKIHYDNRTTIKKHAKRATLSITDARTTDTGIYYVMAKTNYGYFSSFADVIVLKPNDKRPILPIIEENPPEDVEAYVGEEIRICAKVQIDADSMIRWGRNNAIIVKNEIKQIDFGNNYIGLMIPSPKLSSAGDYQLVMANSQIPQVVQANVHLTVTEPPPPLPSEVLVVRKLESAVACCGAQVSFDCSFGLADILYYSVIWHVGHYKINHTNSLFTVISDRGQFILIIHSFEPGMAGEVMCELRRNYPNNQSVKVQRCYAHLTCVPPCVIEDLPEKSLTSKLIRSATITTFNGSSSEFGENRNQRMDDCMDEADVPKDFVLKLVLCKLNDYQWYFFTTTIRSDDPERRLTKFKISENHRVDASTMVEWEDTGARPGISYQLEMLLGDGTYAAVGIIMRTSFVIYELPINLVMVFRISETTTRLYLRDALISIIPPPRDAFRILPSQNIQTEQAFLETFTNTNYNIGAGAFGCVTLVRNKTDLREYAAKIVKARTEKRREHVLREFDIMKQLSHPKIIQLLGLYETKLSFIFVMEYCWGGELFDRVVAEEYMREVDVVRYVRQICEALEYLDYMGIAHLDIKPENIICINPNSTNVKIIDFGVARFLSENIPRAIYGTREYVAPEILDYEPISTYSDMWSVGVVTYVLLSGLMPFAGNNWYERSVNISSVKYDYNDEAFEEVSHVAKEFVDHLLIRKPENRMTASEALNHKWLREGPPQEAGNKRMTKMRKNMKSYLVEFKNHWQRAGNVMIAARRLRMLAHPKPLNEKNKNVSELL